MCWRNTFEIGAKRTLKTAISELGEVHHTGDKQTHSKAHQQVHIQLSAVGGEGVSDSNRVRVHK